MEGSILGAEKDYINSMELLGIKRLSIQSPRIRYPSYIGLSFTYPSHALYSLPPLHDLSEYTGRTLFANMIVDAREMRRAKANTS